MATPYYEFRRNPKDLEIVQGQRCYRFLDETCYVQTIARLASQINPIGAVVLYNLTDAYASAMDLTDSWKEKGLDFKSLYPVEYKIALDDSKEIVRVVTPINSRMVRDRRAILITGVNKLNTSIIKMCGDANKSGASSIETVVLVDKVEDIKKTGHQYSHIGVVIPRVEVGGWGIPLGIDQPPIVSKILYVKA